MKIYLASPFFNEEEAKNVWYVAKKLREAGLEVFVPMEHKIPNGMNMKNVKWANQVFQMDVDAIRKADELVVLYYGMESDSGTSWEQGYAWGSGKGITIINMTDKDCNLMNYNSCDSVINYKDFLIAAPLELEELLNSNEKENILQR